MEINLNEKNVVSNFVNFSKVFEIELKCKRKNMKNQ